MVTSRGAGSDRRDPSLDVDLVIPTIGRASLVIVLASLARCTGPRPGRIVLVDDRAGSNRDLVVGPLPTWITERLLVVRTGGIGPAAARNAGWRPTHGQWVAFIDDDVELPEDWLLALRNDVGTCGDHVGAVQGNVVVPLPGHRRPTDWERNVAGLERARWATADMAYRRDVLQDVGGFDERFRRAYREDADLGLRVVAAGWTIVQGTRHLWHPVRDADGGVSLRVQAGNAEDAFMLVRHGPRWRRRAGVPAGRRPWHLITVAAALLGLRSAVAGKQRTAAGYGLLWAGLTVDFTARRILPGPRDAAEAWRMVWTSALLPFAATAQYLRGVLTLPWRLTSTGPRPGRPAAVLFDRDGTLIHDVAYNGDPDRVVLQPGAREAVARLRTWGVPVGIVSNQSGVARGRLRTADVEAVNARVDELIGPLDVWLYCPHGPDDRCGCRKPSPGLIRRAARVLGVRPADCVVIGDIGTDMEAAAAAGARGILVPTRATRQDEVDAAPEVAVDLVEAVALALGTGVPGTAAAA